MSLKDAFHALVSKKESTEEERKDAVSKALVASECFPIVRSSELDISKYKKIPFTNILALGAAFSQLPLSARTITKTVTTDINAGEPLFVQINPKNVQGFMRFTKDGTSGNIWQINEQGKEVIKGRMRYKQINPTAVKTSVTTVPFDPVAPMIVIMLMEINQKLDGIQKTTNQILQFLTLQEQAKQRGNLETLVDVLNEYKQHSDDAQLCAMRNTEVQTIRREAQQSMIFHQEQIAEHLREQKAIHGEQKAQTLFDSVLTEFAEYQLACHIYAFSVFLDVLLQKRFESDVLSCEIDKMNQHAAQYDTLFAACHETLAAYQRSSIAAQLRGSTGNFAKALGKAIGSVPVIREGPVDEALIRAGNSLGQQNKEKLLKTMQRFEPLEHSRMAPFIDNLKTADILYNHPGSMLMDQDNLYVLENA